MTKKRKRVNTNKSAITSSNSKYSRVKEYLNQDWKKRKRWHVKTVWDSDNWIRDGEIGFPDRLLRANLGSVPGWWGRLVDDVEEEEEDAGLIQR